MAGEFIFYDKGICCRYLLGAQQGKPLARKPHRRDKPPANHIGETNRTANHIKINRTRQAPWDELDQESMLGVVNLRPLISLTQPTQSPLQVMASEIVEIIKPHNQILMILCIIHASFSPSIFCKWLGQKLYLVATILKE